MILNVRLAHQYGKLPFTWLSLVMSMMVSFCATFFPLDVLDEVRGCIESFSEGFPTYCSVDSSQAKCELGIILNDCLFKHISYFDLVMKE